jgi:hypothetical protein
VLLAASVAPALWSASRYVAVMLAVSTAAVALTGDLARR